MIHSAMFCLSVASIADFMVYKGSMAESRTMWQENFPHWLVELAMRVLVVVGAKGYSL